MTYRLLYDDTAHCRLWKEVSARPTLGAWAAGLHPLEWESTWLGVLLHRCVYGPPSVHFFHHLFTAVCSHGRLFNTLGSDPILLYLFFKLFQNEALGALPVGSCVPVKCPILVLFGAYPSDATRCSRLIWNIPCPRPRVRHFSKEPWFLWLENSGTDELFKCDSSMVPFL